MPNSFSQKTQLTCPQTSKPFEFEVWLIIDRDERPDLIEKVKAGTLHTAISPYTGDELGGMDAPLLIYQPSHSPPLFFSPAQQTTQQQDQQQAAGLVQQLQQNLGDKWQNGWLVDGLSGVERNMLPIALSDDPEAELKRRQEEMQAALEKLKEENPEEHARIMAQLEETAQGNNKDDEPETEGPDNEAQLEQLKAENPEEYDRVMKLQAVMQRLMQSDDPEAEMEHIKAEDPELHQRLLKLIETMRNQHQTSDDDDDDELRRILQKLSQPPRDARDMPRRVELGRRALELLPKQGNEQLWGALQVELGNALNQNPLGGRAENLEKAIHHYQQALEVRTREADPERWAATQNNLATAYSDRIKESRADNLEQAIHHYQQALEVYTREADPESWAATQNNLANAYRNRIKESRAENLEQAIHHYQQALEVRTREADPVNHRDTLRNLVLLYFAEKRWAEVYTTAEYAIAVGKDVFAVAVGDAGRMDAIKQTGALYTRAAYSAVQLGRYGDALTQLEAGKARLLAEAQSLGDANLVQLDDDERGRLSELRDSIAALEYEARLSPDNPARREDLAISADLRESRAALRGLIDEFRTKYPDFMPEGLALNDLLANIPADGALVAPLFTDQGSAVFIVPGGVDAITADHVILLDDFKLEDLGAITRFKDDKPGWLRYYINYRFNGAGTETLFDGIEDVTRGLWDAFVGQVHDQLQGLGVQRVLFMPHSDTALVPLHAAWREVDGARRYFMDDYAITYTPSMSTLATARRKSTRGEGALIVGVSEYPRMNNLPNTKAEAEGIAGLFGTEALLNGAATVEAIKNGVTGKAYLHLSCHGGFGWGGNAFASALYLGDEAPLPLPEIMANMKLDAARLVVLSACETGIVDFNNVPDEFVGLPAGFMQAGAAAVVSSLWTVEDRSTALLMEKMYNNMNGDNPMEPAQALRAAQFWLRDATAGEIGDYYQQYLVPRMSQSEAGQAFVEIMMRAAPEDKPYAHPFYWAAFAYNGV